jgi:hypothetical protein
MTFQDTETHKEFLTGDYVWRIMYYDKTRPDVDSETQFIKDLPGDQFLESFQNRLNDIIEIQIFDKKYYDEQMVPMKVKIPEPLKELH